MTEHRARPSRDRWQPTRAGLVDLFYYDEEEFAFRDGHLLLRGNNGTGKSKVLALLLPFLLEGNTASHRVEPDGDPAKRMEWNLLLGGRHPHSERTGYAWCEFGRRDGAREVFVTIGAGLKATAARAGVRSWFFVTDRRVGIDLHLVGPGRTALTQPRLVDALGDRGQVFDQAARYSQAVNETLFDLSQERYEALLSLLIQLRQPQLSKRPDAARLSAALTEALAPVDGALIADVADAFRSLEEERLALTALDESRDAATRFQRIYTDYAKIASRRAAGEPRRTQSAYEDTGRKIIAARAALEAAEVRVDTLSTARAAAQQEQQRIGAHLEALQASEDMRSAERLQHLEEEAARAGGDEARLAKDLEGAADELGRRRSDVAARTREAQAALTAVTQLLHSARSIAQEAGVVGPAPTDLSVRSEVDRAVDVRLRAVDQVRPLIAAVRTADTAAGAARSKRDHAAQQVDGAATRLAEARSAVGEEGVRLLGQSTRWVASLVELSASSPQTVSTAAADDLEAALAELPEWVESLAGPNPLAASTARRVLEVAAALSLEDEGHRQDLDDLVARDAALGLEQTALEQGVDRPPPPSPTRDEPSRHDRLGAPLWRLVEVADGTAPQVCAGVEAALHGAGLLDAWVTPDGGLLDADDAAVTVAGPVDHSLAEVLRPAVDRDDPRAGVVPDEVVSAVLSGIGLGAGSAPTWVASDGRFRIGVLEGRWTSAVAQYLGSGAREAARRARLGEIANARAAIDDQRAHLEGLRRLVADRQHVLAQELAAAPSDFDLRAASTTVGERVGERDRAEGHLWQADTGASSADAELAAARRRRDEAAAERHLPPDEAALNLVAGALHRYQVRLGAIWPAIAAKGGAEQLVAQAEHEAARSAEKVAERTTLAAQAQERATSAATRAAALRSTIGPALDELQRRLADAVRTGGEVSGRIRQLSEEQSAAYVLLGEARGTHAQLTGRLGEDTAARDRSVDRLRAFARTGLLALALPGLELPDLTQPWASSPAVQVARAAEAQLVDVTSDEPVHKTATQRVVQGLSTLEEVLSRSGDSVSYLPGDDGVEVTATFRSQSMTVAQLAQDLTQELVERERIVSAKEREVLETHLVTEVAARLAELIRSAESQVARMNAELEQRPTSTGMQLRFVWREVPDGPAGLAQARTRLLRQTSDAWSDTDRAAIGEFLQAQIAAVRARDEGGTWGEHLAAALDYRHWHRFVVERRTDVGWRPATGPASGGERVLAATIPLFAAAASHYATAGNPHAPRLVLLDEAFAGVDDDSRATCLGLLAEFDLDYVLTSEREWGCYPTVPGLAIAQLSRREGVDAVLVSRWEWDGHTRRRVDDPPRPVVAPPAAQNDVAEGLFT